MQKEMNVDAQVLFYFPLLIQPVILAHMGWCCTLSSVKPGNILRDMSPKWFKIHPTWQWSWTITNGMEVKVIGLKSYFYNLSKWSEAFTEFLGMPILSQGHWECLVVLENSRRFNSAKNKVLLTVTEHVFHGSHPTPPIHDCVSIITVKKNILNTNP